MNIIDTLFYIPRKRAVIFGSILEAAFKQYHIPIDGNLSQGLTLNKTNFGFSLGQLNFSWMFAYANDNDNVNIEFLKKILPYEKITKIHVISSLSDLALVIARIVYFMENEFEKAKDIPLAYPKAVKKLKIQNRDKNGRFAIKLPAVFEFKYLGAKDKSWKNRRIKVISIDDELIKGEDLNDNNKFKMFFRGNINGKLKKVD